MAQHIGTVACSAEGAALCYRTICLEALPPMGEHNHPQITMNSVPMAEDDPLPTLDSTRLLAKAASRRALPVEKVI